MSTQLAFAMRMQEPLPGTGRRPYRRPRLTVLDGGLRGDQLELPFPSRALPATYGDCQRVRLELAPEHAERSPCPWVSCRHHLWHETPERLDGFESLLDDPPAVWPQTCSLDVAEVVSRGISGTVSGVGRIGGSKRGMEQGVELSTKDIAEHLDINRELARRVLNAGLESCRRRPIMGEIGGDVDHADEWAFDRGGVGAAVDWYGGE